MKVDGPSEVHIIDYFGHLIEMSQDIEYDDDNTQCDLCMKKYFPITKGNAYGVIPILGALASCFAAGIVLQALCNTPYSSMGWAGAWFSIGFIMFTAIQVFWGFHAEKIEFLQLWMVCKCTEILAGILGILNMFTLLLPSICLLKLLIRISREKSLY